VKGWSFVAAFADEQIAADPNLGVHTVLGR